VISEIFTLKTAADICGIRRQAASFVDTFRAPASEPRHTLPMSCSPQISLLRPLRSLAIASRLSRFTNNDVANLPAGQFTVKRQAYFSARPKLVLIQQSVGRLGELSDM
jgi:hypothetical protein